MAHAKPEDVMIVITIKVGEKQLSTSLHYTTDPMGLERESELLEERVKLLAEGLGQIWITTARGTKPQNL